MTAKLENVAPARRNRWRSLIARKVPVAPLVALSPEALEAWLVEWIAVKLALSPSAIGRDTAFSEFGLDSMVAVELSGRLETMLGQPVSPSAAWEYPTIAELAAHLLSGEASAPVDLDD